MSHITTQTVLVTGASTGIGYELTKLFAADGYNLILVARGEVGLQKVKGEMVATHKSTVLTITEDLSVPGASKRVFDLIHSKGITVDVLINNAGFGTHGDFTDVPLADQLGMMQVNMNALVELTYYFLPAMKKNKQGKILNIASTAAFQSGPGMAIYFATKAFVVSFSGALSIEAKKDSVLVAVLCPGTTKTEFSKRAHAENTRLFQTGMMSGEEVARIGYAQLQHGKALKIAGFVNSIGAFATRFVSRKTAAEIAYKAQELSRK